MQLNYLSLQYCRILGIVHGQVVFFRAAFRYQLRIQFYHILCDKPYTFLSILDIADRGNEPSVP